MFPPQSKPSHLSLQLMSQELHSIKWNKPNSSPDITSESQSMSRGGRRQKKSASLQVHVLLSLHPSLLCQCLVAPGDLACTLTALSPSPHVFPVRWPSSPPDNDQNDITRTLADHNKHHSELHLIPDYSPGDCHDLTLTTDRTGRGIRHSGIVEWSVI